MFKVVQRALSTTGDMATYLDATDEVPTSTARHRAGTIPFMARDLLVDEPPVHLYRHDLESPNRSDISLKPFFHILVWASVHFDIRNKTSLSTHTALKRWDDDSLDDARSAKCALFLTYGDAFSGSFVMSGKNSMRF